MHRVLRPLLVAVALGALGCAGGGLSGNTFWGHDFAFRIPPVPAGWTPIEVSHAALSFRDEAHVGTVVLNGRCNVDGEDVPLAALTQHLFIRFTEREVEEQQVVPFDGREAMRTVVVAKLDGVPLKFDAWVLKKDGCVYDLTYLAPPARFAEGVASFEAFVRGFSTISRNSNAH